jgi:ABC-2 type transport system ATP-binding protein
LQIKWGILMVIKVNSLSKDFKVYEKKQGFLSMLRNLIDFDYKIVKAVDGIDFTIKKGEMVGFIGPNGAGKSTTVKMLCGILLPTSGEVLVNGLNPVKNRKKVAKNIGVVFGQKTQLIWDLPAIESLELLKDIYDIPKETYKYNMGLFNELLGIDSFIKKPVRQLSLGQRMKADICASLIHDPEIIYFDEPTIGLDAVAKENIREFIKKLNREKGTTVLFTTHDMDDIEKTCNRIIIIDGGKIIYDGNITDIKKSYSSEKIITIQLDKYIENICIAGLLAKDGPENKKIFTIPDNVEEIRKLINTLFENYQIRDILISDVDIEEIIRKIYNGKVDLSSINMAVR